MESHIAETWEAALAAHQAALHSGAHIVAYTDGSMTEQGVGPAVVSPLGLQTVCIGPPATHTVYAAGLRGIEMALAQIRNMGGLASQRSYQACMAIVFTDNQAAIQASSAPRRSSGQYILREIMWECSWNIQLYWLPGYEGIYSNECSDALAKEAANSPAPNSAEELILTASTQRTLCMEAASTWKTEWAATTHRASLRRLSRHASELEVEAEQTIISACIATSEL